MPPDAVPERQRQVVCETGALRLDAGSGGTDDHAMRTGLPTGTVTFLFTDIEGSTRLLHDLGEEDYAKALAEHRRVLREAFERHGGVEVDTQGDAFFIAFPTAPGALEAAEAAQRELGLPVRMGLHTGTPLLNDDGYVGTDVHRAARIAAAGHGRQVLVSTTTAALVDRDLLRDLGEHRLKDLSAPERIYQLGDAAFPQLKSLFRTNLPIPATPFLGREHELAVVRELLMLEDTRLLTLTGPGGSGKTRLALQAVAESADAFPDGAFWVALAPLRDPSLLSTTLSQALNVGEQPNGTVTDLLVAALADKRAMLLLDNCEHLLAGVAALVLQLLDGCPRLAVVCSSRERLGLRAEHVFPVPPMTVSDGEALFADRARAVEPGFVPDDHVPVICAELDELPLAIELAAARVRSLSTAAIRERLAERLPLLGSRDRDRDERQRTLEATIAWSYDLLAPGEQRVLRVLSVFAGGCALQATETVAGANLDRLESLLDKSLLRHRIDEAGEDRYWLLETIREYASLRLRESGEAGLARQAHRRYFLERAAAITGDGFTSHDGSEGPLFRADRANFRVVLLEALASEDAATALSLVASLAHIWHRAGEVADGYRLAQAALALVGGNERDRARAAHLAGDMAVDLGEYDEAASLLNQAEEAAIALDDLALLGDVQYTRSYLAGAADYAAGADLARLAAETARKSGSLAGEMRALQMELQFKRLAASDRDDVDRQALERCLALGEGLLARSRTLDNPLIEAFLYQQLAQVLFALSRYDDALRHGQESLRLRATTRTSSQAMADVLIIGLICGGLGDHPTAVTLVTAALAAYESEGFRTDGEDDRNLMRLESDARQTIGNDAYELAAGAGKALTLDQAVELALDYPQTDRPNGIS